MILTELVYSTVANRCPRCHQGKVFESGNPYDLKKMFQMKETCPVCQLTYERESGFFYGAMYVSYGLMAGVFIVWFLADLLWLHLDAIVLALCVTGSVFALSPLAFRWARLIWLNFFVHYDKRYNKPRRS